MHRDDPATRVGGPAEDRTERSMYVPAQGDGDDPAVPLIRGRHPRQVLNEIRWRGLDLTLAQVEIVHRGAPNDTITVRADQIVPGRSFFQVGETEIPYHRIKKIVYDGRTIFSRAELERGRL